MGLKFHRVDLVDKERRINRRIFGAFHFFRFHEADLPTLKRSPTSCHTPVRFLNFLYPFIPVLADVSLGSPCISTRHDSQVTRALNSPSFIYFRFDDP